ncbi:MAG: protein translocase subunit SecF [Synechococcus sp.]
MIALQLSRSRRRVWWVSLVLVTFSVVGLGLSWANPTIQAPLRPGLDFTGGTQIQLERRCEDACTPIQARAVEQILADVSLSPDGTTPPPKLDAARVQILDGGQSLSLRTPALSAAQSQEVIAAVTPLAGPFETQGQAVDTIGPSLGSQLLVSSLVSLLVAFAGIALYISVRYDGRYAVLALLALAHDVVIVCGIFAWLGQWIGLEVDSLFAVALLTIAGYSVNDTVVVFDRIRERQREDRDLPVTDQVDRAVSTTLTRTIYTSGTTLMPLITLILFGGATLFWFAIALALGVIVGSWSSIALAPSLLTIWSGPRRTSASA